MKKLYLTLSLSVFLQAGFGQILIGSNVSQFSLGDDASIISDVSINVPDGLQKMELGQNASLVSGIDIIIGSNIEEFTLGDGASLQSGRDMSIGSNIGSNVPFTIGNNGSIIVGGRFMIESDLIFGNNSRFSTNGLFTNSGGITVGSGSTFDFNGLMVNNGNFDVGDNAAFTFNRRTTNNGTFIFGENSEVFFLDTLNNVDSIYIGPSSDFVFEEVVNNEGTFATDALPVLSFNDRVFNASDMLFGEGAEASFQNTLNNDGTLDISSNSSIAFQESVINTMQLLMGSSSTLNFTKSLSSNGNGSAISFQNSDGVAINIEGDFINEGSFLIGTNSTIDLQNNFTNSGAVSAGRGSILSISNDFTNANANRLNIAEGATLELLGDWIDSGSEYRSPGELKINGFDDQTIPRMDYQVARFTYDKVGGDFELEGSKMAITEELNLVTGVLKVNQDATLTVGSESSSGTINEDTPGDAYIEGEVTWRNIGESTPKFPMGANNSYAPIELLNITGGSSFKAKYQNPNTIDPLPGNEVLGVSSIGLWTLEQEDNTSAEEVRLFIDFENEDLQNFVNTNEISNDFNSPVVTYSLAPDSLFTTLGVASYSGDSASYGMIESAAGLVFRPNQPIYIALGRAPLVPPNASYFIPEVFSPSSTMAENKVFKVFSEALVDTAGISMKIYNKYGTEVHSIDGYDEFVEGWDGRNKAGSEEPQGTYFYYLRFAIRNEVDTETRIVEMPGEIYLIR